jgi:hypothetical protein
MPNANWSNPTLTSTYTNFVTEVKNRDEDLALQFDGTTSTNLPVNTIRWDSSANRWRKWSGSSWVELTATYALTALSTTGNASVGGTLGVTGAATLSSTLDVTGAITGSSTVSGAALIPTSAAVPTTGVFRPAANTLAWATASTERLRIGSTGAMGFNSSVLGGVNGAYRFAGSLTGGVNSNGINYTPTVQIDATNSASLFISQPSTASNGGTPYTLNVLRGFFASQGTFNEDSTVTEQRGFEAPSNLTGAATNYGFLSNLGTAVGRWNFFANGTAPNYFAGDVRTNRVVTARSTPANSNVSATATATSLLDGLRTGTPTANINLTLPTGTDMDAAFQELQTNQSFEWSAINLAAATHVITVVANTAHTVVGNMGVAAATSGRFLTRKTAANTFVTYRIG